MYILLVLSLLFLRLRSRLELPSAPLTINHFAYWLLMAWIFCSCKLLQKSIICELTKPRVKCDLDTLWTVPFFPEEGALSSNGRCLDFSDESDEEKC